jgi:hypothetical protein
MRQTFGSALMTGNITDKNSKTFTELAREKRSSLLAEFWFFLKHNKKWWLLPLLVMLLLLGLIVLLGGSGIAPFIYPLF